MGRIRSFLSLSVGDKVRLLAAVVLLPVLWIGIVTSKFTAVRTVLLKAAGLCGRFIPGSPSPQRVAWAVKLADRHLPGRRTCLVRSLATEGLLTLYGYEATHQIGVDKAGHGGIEAHSWIEYDGNVLIGDLEELSRYERFPSLDIGDEL